MPCFANINLGSLFRCLAVYRNPWRECRYLARIVLAGGMLMSCSSVVQSSAHREVIYQVTFQPKTQSAQVNIAIKQAKWLKSVKFKALPSTRGAIRGNGRLQLVGSNYHWFPPQKNAQLSYEVELNAQKPNGGFNIKMENTWALLRGENLFPSFRARKQKGVTAQTTIEFLLPKHWAAVNTGWSRVDGNRFALKSGKRALVRPKGWLIAGDLGTRHERLANTHLTISAPKGHDFRQMETLAFVSLVWPQLRDAFSAIPERILITGAGDPMWRGGLSSPTSLYVHSDRPLVSENGTSTIIHELVHVVTGIHGDPHSDWIVEGLAEYYSVELLFRAGAFSVDRRQLIMAGLSEWGKSVDTLLLKTCSGPATARAASLIDQLDKEIQQCRKKDHNIDDLVEQIMGNKSVTLVDVNRAFVALCGTRSKVLDSPLLSLESAVGT